MLPAPLLLLAVSVDVISKFSLLEFVLARWCPDEVPHFIFFELALIWEVDVVIFDAQNIVFH